MTTEFIIEPFGDREICEDLISALSKAGVAEIAEKILSYLDDRSLIRAESVCRRWKQVIENADSILWRDVLKRKIGSSNIWRKIASRKGWIKDILDHFSQDFEPRSQHFRNLFFATSDVYFEKTYIKDHAKKFFLCKGSKFGLKL